MILPTGHGIAQGGARRAAAECHGAMRALTRHAAGADPETARAAGVRALEAAAVAARRLCAPLLSGHPSMRKRERERIDSLLRCLPARPDRRDTPTGTPLERRARAVERSAFARLTDPAPRAPSPPGSAPRTAAPAAGLVARGTHRGRTTIGFVQGAGAPSAGVAIPAQGHLLTIGPTGAGKSAGQAIPALLTYEGSAIVVDPKAELYGLTHRRRRAMGQTIWRIDPYRVLEPGPGTLAQRARPRRARPARRRGAARHALDARREGDRVQARPLLERARARDHRRPDRALHEGPLCREPARP